LYQCLQKSGKKCVKDITADGTIIVGSASDFGGTTGRKNVKILTWNECTIDTNTNYFIFNRSNLSTTAHYLSDLVEKNGTLLIKEGRYKSNPNYSSANEIKWRSDNSSHTTSQKNLSFGICFDDDFNILGNSLK
jgi:hypothetical protein